MTVTPPESELPDIISVDAHVLEPQDLWQEELPASMRERGPKGVRERAKIVFEGGGMRLYRDVPDGDWCDVWLFDDLVLPTGMLHACGGLTVDQHENRPATYDEFRPGTHDQAARLADMDEGHVEVSINYPNTFPRFAGQGFAERADHDLGLACLQIYNDWMIDEWCGGAGKGRGISAAGMASISTMAAPAASRAFASATSWSAAPSARPCTR